METVPAKNIVIRVKKPAQWFGADYNMNIYRGCPHGCIYCDSRSDCYGDKDFDTVKAKENALEIIRDDLRRKVRRGVIATGAMSDPYNPHERTLRLTRNALELVNAYEFGVAVDTKSTHIVRDLDILQDIKSHSPVIIKMTVTTADDGLCGKLEPHVPASSERFKALKALSGGGIYCGVLMMPILPFINDTEDNICKILDRAKESGAQFVYPAFGMTLRAGNREYYYEKLDENFPDIKLKEKYINRFGDRYQCTSPKAKKLWDVFKKRCEALGLAYNMGDIVGQYKMGYGDTQLSLF